ncbi:MAG: hypothetical protein K5650_04100 [Bacteroidales bacterium]|nr:hypothetical protein [Bacteroidales bacterium]
MLRRVVISLLFSLCLTAAAQDVVCGGTVRLSDRAQYDQAVAAYNRRDYSSCSSTMRKVSAKNPKAADPYFYLGMCAVRKDFNAVGIRRYFTKLMTICPDYPNPLAHFYMGVIYYSDDRFDEAVECIQRYFDMLYIKPNKDAETAYAEASNYLHWATFLAEATRNTVPFYPTVVRGVSSKRNETLPYLTHDGNWFYYLRQVPANTNKTFYTKDIEEQVYRLYRSRLKDTAFTAGEPLDEPFNQGQDEGTPTLTADGRTIYYSVLTANKHGYANCDIFFTTMRGGKWDDRSNAGRNVNGDDTWESQPSISPDGRYLYFASNRQGGYGGTDIWRCRRLSNGDWSRAENLGPTVNTAGNEKSPYLHADGHTLYFASDGWQGFGGYDLYFINTGDASAVRPTNLGLPINSEHDEICFGVTADGERAYYSGRSADYSGVGGTDVFMFELYPSARPEPMKAANSSAKAADGSPIAATVTVSRAGQEDAVYIADSVDGRFTVMLSCQNDNVLTVCADGYAPQFLSVSSHRVRQGTSLPGTVKLVPLTGDVALKLDLKLQNDGTPTAATAMLLDALARFLLEHPMVHAAVFMPRAADAAKLHSYLTGLRLRPERLSYRGGTDITQPQIVLHTL